MWRPVICEGQLYVKVSYMWRSAICEGQLYVKVAVLLTCGKHAHDRIILIKQPVLSHCSKTMQNNSTCRCRTNRGRRDRDRMVVGFTTTYMCYQYLLPLIWEFESRSWRGVLDTTLCDKVYCIYFYCFCLVQAICFNETIHVFCLGVIYLSISFYLTHLRFGIDNIWVFCSI
jgi:hypothetical protein